MGKVYWQNFRYFTNKFIKGIFDCLDQELFITELNAYGSILPALKLTQIYLSNRKQRTKINSSYSEWLQIIFGVPEGSIFGPLLFNIFLADLFLNVDDIKTDSYEHDYKTYVSGKDIEKVIQSLEKTSKIVFKWFSDNLVKSNAGKCHLLESTSNKINIRTDNFDISNSKREKLLGIKFDHKLTFDNHISELCKNASQKIHTWQE